MAILIFGVGQLVLPSIAAHVVRSRLDKYGRVISVSVSAFPAIELAFSDADTVKVRMADFNASQLDIANQIGQSSGVSNLTVHVEKVTSGLLTVTNASFTKHGSALSGSGDISEASLRSSIPLVESIKPIGTENGQLVLQGTANVPFLGQYTGDFTVGPSDGGIVVTPPSVFATFIGSISIFSSPKITVDSVSGQATASGLTVSATGRLN